MCNQDDWINAVRPVIEKRIQKWIHFWFLMKYLLSHTFNPLLLKHRRINWDPKWIINLWMLILHHFLILQLIRLLCSLTSSAKYSAAILFKTVIFSPYPLQVQWRRNQIQLNGYCIRQKDDIWEKNFRAPDAAYWGECWLGVKLHVWTPSHVKLELVRMLK